MKKIFVILVKAILMIMAGIASFIVTIAFLIGCAEGDLSHGIFYYLQ